MQAEPRLVDQFGRVATDLRISLTDRCSLRCTYCMPAEGMQWIASDDLLSGEEIISLAQIFIGLGVRSIRLTGGEPLLYRDLSGLIKELAQCTPRPELSLTTNGISLADSAVDLVDAGLDRINISVDTLDRDTFTRLTRRNRLEDVLLGVAAAAKAGLAPLKINSVLQRGINLDEAPALLEWALSNGYQLRFIEHMPLDAQHDWRKEEMVTAEEIQEVLGTHFVLRPAEVARGHAPAEEYDVLDGPGRDTWPVLPPRVGIIASVTRPFCRDCDRLRLTSDGQLRTCLFANSETDLRDLLRSGASVEAVEETILAAVAGKQAGHGINNVGFLQPIRPMSAIGG